MFESLEDQMKADENAVTTPKERVLRWVGVVVIALFVFSALYFGVRMLE